VLLCPLGDREAKAVLDWRQAVLDWRQRLFLLTGVDPRRCQRCGGELLAQPLPSPPIWDSS
jgi:hypothetical protein